MAAKVSPPNVACVSFIVSTIRLFFCSFILLFLNQFCLVRFTACKGLMDVSILTATPIIMGVLTCLDEEQANKRSTGDNNHGVDWGKQAPAHFSRLALDRCLEIY